MRSIITPILCLGLLLVFPAAAQQDEGGATPDAPQNLEGGGEPQSADTIPVDGGDEPPPEDDDDSVTYSGIGVARVNVKLKNPNIKIDGAINLAAVIGFRIPVLKGLGAEIELGQTIIPGQITETSCMTVPNVPPPGSTTTCSNRDRGDFGMNFAAGLYAVYRSPGKFYGMGKVGYRYAGTNIQELQADRSGSAYAGGVGYRWNPKKSNGVELYYNKFTSQITYYGLNISYGFGRRN